MTPKKQVAIVYLSHDGISSRYTGVGSIADNFFDVLEQILPELSFDAVIYPIGVKLSTSALGYNLGIKQKRKQLAIRTHGEMHEIDNGTNFLKQYGSYINWQKASQAAACLVEEIKKIHAYVLIFCVDTPFLQVPHYVAQDHFERKCIFVLVPHSDVFVHNRVPFDLSRFLWERKAFDLVKTQSNVYLAASSKFLGAHLQEKHGIPQKKILELQTGINVHGERFNPIPQDAIAKLMHKYHIPLEKPIIFSIARAEKYKGFETLIKACQLLHTDYHLVFIASPYSPKDSIIDELTDLINRTNISCTPIFELSFTLANNIAQWKHTKVVAQLSYKEPFGLVPEETRLWSQVNKVVVLASNKDGFIEQINHGEDGFLVNPHDINAVSFWLEYILNLDKTMRTKISNAGYERAIKDYDTVRILKNFFENILAKIII